MRDTAELQGECRNLVLDLVERNVFAEQQVVVQIQGVVTIPRYVVVAAVARSQKGVDNDLHLPVVEPFGRLLAGRVVRGRGAVCGRKGYQQLRAVGELRLDETQELVQVLVQAVEHVFVLDRLGSVSLGYVSRRVQTYIQNIGIVVLSHFAYRYHAGGQLQEHGIARRRISHAAYARGCAFEVGIVDQTHLLRRGVVCPLDDRHLRVDVFVEVVKRAPTRQLVEAVRILRVVLCEPCRQSVGVIARRGPVRLYGLRPVHLPRFAGQNNSREGVDGYGNYLAMLVFGSESIAQRRGYEPSGRVAARACAVLDALLLVVVYQPDDRVVGIVVPAVAYDAVHAWLRTGRERCEGYWRGRRPVVVRCVAAYDALGGEAAQPAVGHVGRVSFDIARAHRAHDDIYRQPRRSGRRRCERECCDRRGDHVFRIHSRQVFRIERQI